MSLPKWLKHPFRQYAAFRNRLSFCQCHKITAGHQPGWFERVLLRLLPHLDIVKEIPTGCEGCKGSGFSYGQGCGYGDVCGTCGGQSVYPQTVLYLRRFYLWRSKWIGKNWGDLYLHHIVRSDDDPDPHDHPWSFWTFPVLGRYFDEQWSWAPPSQPYTHAESQIPSFLRRTLHAGLREKLPGQWVMSPTLIHRDARHIHRVLLEPGRTAWTFVLTGRHTFGPTGDTQWFFITENGPVYWRTYLGLPTGINPEE